MGKTFKDRKDVRRNYKEISKLKKKEKRRIKDEDKFDEDYRRRPDGR
jgi:hypothetical protein